MTNYEQAAVQAVRLLRGRTVVNPSDAWEKATIGVFGKGRSQQIKSCPRNTFVGLCDAGLVKGILPGSHTRSRLNKRYAIDAVKILKQKPQLASNKQALWRAASKGKIKSYNEQMDVVVALWNNNLIQT